MIRIVLTGKFVDSHIHVAMLGESLHYVNLIDCFSIEAMIDKIREKLQCEPTLPFVVGFNWDQTKLGRMPTRSDIDNISEKPVVGYILFY